MPAGTVGNHDYPFTLMTFRQHVQKYLHAASTGWLARFAASVLNAYYWNSRYVFGRAKDISLAQVGKTFVAYGCTAALGFVLLYAQINWWSISEKLAPLIVLFITVPINFILNNVWTFDA